ncbi:TPA: hypothetical protein ACU8BY_000273 [Neisseria subflava]
MSNKQHKQVPSHAHDTEYITYDSPIMVPEITNISAGVNYLILRFGYKKDDRNFVINASISLTYEQARDLVEKIDKVIDSYEEYEKQANFTNEDR